MNIWKWVGDAQKDLREAGNGRLADLIDEIPQNVCAGQQALAQAALPEALALARSVHNAWLEVYFKHWITNGRVSRHEVGEAALKDTVSLFEFAHREETMKCPQSVCTTQDIAICYGHVDGPGYAPERIAVCKETLGRIDPSWACFACIGSELADALLDDGQATEALAVADRHRERMDQEGSGAGMSFELVRARASFALGHFDETLAILKQVDDKNFEEDGEQMRFKRACLRFRTLACQGLFEEAWAALPPESSNVNFRENLDIAAGLELVLTALPQHNDFRAGRRTASALRRYHDGGAHRNTLHVLNHHVRLAVARGARWVAQQALDLGRPHLEKLRIPMDAPQEFAQLEALVAAMSPVAELPVPAEELVEHIQNDAGSSPEHDLELLLLAAEQLPHDAGLAEMIRYAMVACGAADQARAHAWSFVRANSESFDAGADLLGLLVEADDRAGIGELATLMRPVNPALAHWCLARLAFLNEQWDVVGEHVTEVLALAPDRSGTRRLWARAAMHAKQFDLALSLWDAVAADDDVIGVAHWDALVAASAAQRWDRVRELAAQLDIKLEGSEGIVEENWELIRIQQFHKGERFERYARRTGPVTARILGLSGGDVPQFARDRVVFEPTGREAWPEDDDEAKRFVQLYDLVHVMEAGRFGRGYLVDGILPDEERFDRMTADFDALDWEWSVRSDDDYVVTDSASGEEHRGVYFLVAAPDNVTPRAMHDKLTTLLADLSGSLCWTSLADAAGVEQERHAEMAERLGL